MNATQTIAYKAFYKHLIDEAKDAIAEGLGDDDIEEQITLTAVTFAPPELPVADLRQCIEDAIAVAHAAS